MLVLFILHVKIKEVIAMQIDDLLEIVNKASNDLDKLRGLL